MPRPDQAANAFASFADDGHGKNCSIEEDYEPAHTTRGSISNDGVRYIPVSPSHQATPIAARGEEATTGLINPSATDMTFSTAKEIPQEGGTTLKEATAGYPSANVVCREEEIVGWSSGKDESHRHQNALLQSQTKEPRRRTSTMAPSTGGDEMSSREGALVQHHPQRQILDEGAGAMRSTCRENEHPRRRRARAELFSGMATKHEIMKGEASDS